ncbi:hypothetical protein ACQP00_30590 [Dactylosporangium sp. CS-047395]|uniref:hypothetical protein n=1 Tax=Dactylosporangium sp. CS-047395 TaxID=3239936 RepID=UPI003D921F4D
MLRTFRLTLLGFAVVCLVSILAQPGGLFEFARGKHVTTAQLGSCVEDYDMVENATVTCTATWDEGAVQGTVHDVDTKHPTITDGKTSGAHFEIRVADDELTPTVFASGTDARPYVAKWVWLGAAALMLVLALAAWEAVVLFRAPGMFSRKRPEAATV